MQCIALHIYMMVKASSLTRILEHQKGRPVTITALQLLKAAQARGWTMKVWSADAPDYAGNSASLAWEAVKATEEATVTFHSATGQRLGAAFLMAPGPQSCAPDETLVDHSCTGGDFEALCDSLTEVVH
jgi:hypothetical protein